MVSIKDVARHAGVAVSTVSKVINHYPNVSQETKERVNEAIRELHFVPNTIAAALSSKQAGRIALVLDLNTRTKAVDEIDLQYLSGAIRKAEERKLDVITVFFSMLADKTPEEIIQYFQSQSIAGIVLYGLNQNHDRLRQLIDSQAFKVVVVDAPFVNRSTSSVSIDNARAQYEVAKRTWEENGGGRVLYLAGKPEAYVTGERLSGIRRLAEEKGLQVLVRNGNFSELEARKLTFQYAKGKDLIVCASDLMAIGAMHALMEMDIFRPVCGFDGLALMGYAGNQMYTVRQDFAGISEEAVEELYRLLSGGTGTIRRVPHKLVRLQYMDMI